MRDFGETEAKFQSVFERQLDAYYRKGPGVPRGEIADISNEVIVKGARLLDILKITYQVEQTRQGKEIVIVPDKKTSLGRFAAAILRRYGYSVRLGPHEMLRERFQAQIFVKTKVLYLTTESIGVGGRLGGAEIHEVKHLRVEDDIAAHRSNPFLGWLSSKKGHLPGLRTYAEIFSLDELLTYPLDLYVVALPLRLWETRLLDERPLSQAELSKLRENVQGLLRRVQGEFDIEPKRMAEIVRAQTAVALQSLNKPELRRWTFYRISKEYRNTELGVVSFTNRDIETTFYLADPEEIKMAKRILRKNTREEEREALKADLLSRLQPRIIQLNRASEKQVTYYNQLVPFLTASEALLEQDSTKMRNQVLKAIKSLKDLRSTGL